MPTNLLTCPSCHASLNLSGNTAGKKLVCPHCGTVFLPDTSSSVHSKEQVLQNLLSLWERHNVEGRSMTPAELCRDHPELVPELERGIAALRQLDRLAIEGKMSGMISLEGRESERSGEEAAQDSSLGPAPNPSIPRPRGVSRLGRFELRRELGRGGCGIVYLAWDGQLHREVALKVPRTEELLTAEWLQRFLREARAAAGLDHPGIVPVYDVGEVEGVCYIVSAYCPGGNLAQWQEQQAAPPPPHQAAAVVAALAEAVQYIHQHNICHRDIKPSNVLLQPLDRPAADGLPFIPRLADFGIAKILEAKTRLTHSGAILGTPAYMAPEQAAGRPQEVGPHTDVYALGAILYELLTGRPPLQGHTPLDMLRRKTDEEPLPPRLYRSDVPRSLEIICLKCLEKEPWARYPSAGELAADLRRFLAGESIKARAPTWHQQTWKWCMRPERFRSAGMFLLVFGLLFFLWCAGGLVAALLGVLRPSRLGEFVRYLLVHIGLFYLPMMWAGWRVLGHSRRALWAGTLIALAFFLRMVSVEVIWCLWLGHPQPLAMGGFFERTADRAASDLLFSAVAGVLCGYCGIALIGSYSKGRQLSQATEDAAPCSRETVPWER